MKEQHTKQLVETATPRVSVSSTVREKSSKSNRKMLIDQDMRQHMIEEAAYFLAEKRGFKGGSSFDDWINAEKQIDAILM